MRDFSALYPNIEIELIETNTSLNLARREAGVAIRFAHWPGPPAEVKAVRSLRTSLTVDDMSAAIGAVRTGIGATRMACFLGDSDPDLARVPGKPLFAQLPLWVLTHADLRYVPRIRVFLDFVARRLLDLRPLFQGEAREGAPKRPVLD